MNTNVLRAVFRRNFVSYFANPTGYVFVCVFVLLSSLAAFWPYAFFNSNLANLDQLTSYFPLIMLCFIPAITMSVWADERRQGTDELLLTIPANDFDIVLGKYLAAVAIYSVALAFSLVCNCAILYWLSAGNIDVGLFIGTYVGYWLVGVAMLAIGMVASFLTTNITVAFILGALLNAPLVAGWWSDAILGQAAARTLKEWSIGNELNDFGRGIVSLSGLVYFGAIAAVMLYVSMVLIGRRHWVRGRDWYVMAGHYVLRTVALVVVLVAANVIFHHFDARCDTTTEKLSSLSKETRQLLDGLELKRPVQIEAFISPDVPEWYVQSRLDLLTMLRELEARGRGNVQLRVYPTDLNSSEAERAEKRYDITPKRVPAFRRGAYSEEHIFMGVAMTCGLEKVTLPFIDRGIPVEYELARSIATVTQQKRRKVGVLRTDAQLYGGFNFQSMGSSPNWPIVDELQKMYEVVSVDASSPIKPYDAKDPEYDVILAVQPSTLTPEQLVNFMASIRSGQPTAIFEDPFTRFASEVPGTKMPRRPPGGMMNPMMMQGQMPKAERELAQLWDLLGVGFSGETIVWQSYNPFPPLEEMVKREREFVFIKRVPILGEPFNDEERISSKLELMLFPYPGAITPLNKPSLKVEPLVRTGTKAGTSRFEDLMQMMMFGQMRARPDWMRDATTTSYVLAARIHGRVKAEALPMPPQEGLDEAPKGSAEGSKGTGADPAAEPKATTTAVEKSAEKAKEKEKPKPAPPKDAEINVVLVADIDMLHQTFFELRAQGDVPERGLDFNFDNVTFVLNVLDELAGDERFLDIRKRRPKHRTLTRVDEQAEAARRETAETREKLQKEFRQADDEEQKAVQKAIADLQAALQKQGGDAIQEAQRIQMETSDRQRRADVKREELRQDLERKTREIDTKQNLAIEKVQFRYKFWAAALPPIPPLLVGLGVFFARRAREREGVARTRLRG